MESLVSIINASFDKIMFLSGLVLIMITVFGSNPITIAKLKLPALDNIGRTISGIVGFLLIIASLFVWFFSTTNVGLFAPPPGAKNISLFQIITPAYAESSVEITLPQYRPTQIKLDSAESLGVYVDNIKPTSPSRLILFKTQNLKPEFWNTLVSYSAVKKQLSNDAILFEDTVEQEGKYSFLYKNKKYVFQVKEIFWYLFGSDYITLVVTQ